MSLSIYIRVAKVCCCMCSVQLPRSTYDSYFKGECRLWKAGSLMKSPQNAGKRPSMHPPHSRRPKSHTHSFCHPSLSNACCICVTKYWKKTTLSFIEIPLQGQKHSHSESTTNSVFILQFQLIIQ